VRAVKKYGFQTLEPKQVKANNYLQTSQKHIFAVGDVTAHLPITGNLDYLESNVNKSFYFINKIGAGKYE